MILLCTQVEVPAVLTDTTETDDMNKREALEHAAAAAHACKVISARIARYSATFGYDAPLTQDALLERDAAYEVCIKWKRIAALHPSTRAAMTRQNRVPAFMFTYSQPAK